MGTKPLFFARSDGRRCLILLILFLLLLCVMLLGLRYGSLALSLGELLQVLWVRPEGVEYEIIFNIRMPRVILGVLVGSALAVSGAILQGVMRNDLASPGIIGVSAGGGLTGIILILLLPAYYSLMVPAAFSGSLGTVVLVYLLAWRRGAAPSRLILAGVAVSAMLGAFSSMVLLMNADKAGSVLDFTIGSLSTRSWEHIRMVVWYITGGLLLALLYARKLNVLALGDEVATGLGMRVERTRLVLLAIAAVLAAAVVSVAGLLGFVGLIAPHMVRLVIGSDNRFVLPCAALFGASLVVGCDTIGRMAMEPAELPVGIIMALLGPPFFLYLLRRRSHEN